MHKLDLDQQAAWHCTLQSWSMALLCALAGDHALSQLQAALSSNHDLAMLGSASSKRMIDVAAWATFASTPAVTLPLPRQPGRLTSLLPRISKWQPAQS